MTTPSQPTAGQKNHPAAPSGARLAHGRNPNVKILRFAAVGVAAALTLTACGNGDDASDTPTDAGTPEAATIKLWLNGTDTPDALRGT